MTEEELTQLQQQLEALQKQRKYGQRVPFFFAQAIVSDYPSIDRLRLAGKLKKQIDLFFLELAREQTLVKVEELVADISKHVKDSVLLNRATQSAEYEHLQSLVLELVEQLHNNLKLLQSIDAQELDISQEETAQYNQLSKNLVNLCNDITSKLLHLRQQGLHTSAQNSYEHIHKLVIGAAALEKDTKALVSMASIRRERSAQKLMQSNEELLKEFTNYLKRIKRLLVKFKQYSETFREPLQLMLGKQEFSSLLTTDLTRYNQSLEAIKILTEMHMQGALETTFNDFCEFSTIIRDYPWPYDLNSLKDQQYLKVDVAQNPRYGVFNELIGKYLIDIEHLVRRTNLTIRSKIDVEYVIETLKNLQQSVMSWSKTENSGAIPGSAVTNPLAEKDFVKLYEDLKAPDNSKVQVTAKEAIKKNKIIGKKIDKTNDEIKHLNKIISKPPIISVSLRNRFKQLPVEFYKSIKNALSAIENIKKNTKIIEYTAPFTVDEVNKNMEIVHNRFVQLQQLLASKKVEPVELDNIDVQLSFIDEAQAHLKDIMQSLQILVPAFKQSGTEEVRQWINYFENFSLGFRRQFFWLHKDFKEQTYEYKLQSIRDLKEQADVLLKEIDLYHRISPELMKALNEFSEELNKRYQSLAIIKEQYLKTYSAHRSYDTLAVFSVLIAEIQLSATIAEINTAKTLLTEKLAKTNVIKQNVAEITALLPELQLTLEKGTLAPGGSKRQNPNAAEDEKQSKQSKLN